MSRKKVFLNHEFDKIWKKIEEGENISILRYADGERAVMIGESVAGVDGWTSPNHVSKLGKDLLKALEINDKNVYYGISCPCCDHPAYYWYSTRISNPNITFANLWVNANHPRFIKSFEKLNREAVIIANYRAEGKQIGNLKILMHYSISDDCFDFWENQGEKLLSDIKRDFGDKKDLLFVISAGPMSEPIIAELYKNNPNNCYIDFGSSIDRYYRGKQTRPYEDRWSVYANRNCWMYDPQIMNFDVSVILTLYQRPAKLLEQLDAVENQTLKPREIILFHDASTPPIDFEFDEKLRSRITNYIKLDKNVGVWGRFAGGLLATSKYVCFFDDDTIPGNRWLENCHTQIVKRKGLYGAIGIDSWNLNNYPYRSFRRWGWDGAWDNTKEVDFAGHSWFLEKDWLGALWINNSQFYAFKYVAEDVFLSYSLNKWINIKTYVPPHPKNDLDLYGSTPGKAEEYGQEPDVAISLNPRHLDNMNKAMKLLVAQGMKAGHCRLSNIFSRDYVADYIADRFFPKGSKRRDVLMQCINGTKRFGSTYIADKFFPMDSRRRRILTQYIKEIKRMSKK
ncbi:MAG: glycosyltransferase family 2 protein [Anaerolineaceae bacterium]|nr:MAG: glycosyltransferase family 2 protein [Anaerolineaceae bacterium]